MILPSKLSILMEIKQSGVSGERFAYLLFHCCAEVCNFALQKVKPLSRSCHVIC